MPWAPLMKLKQTETVTETLQAIALRGSRGLVPRQRHDRADNRGHDRARDAAADNLLDERANVQPAGAALLGTE